MDRASGFKGENRIMRVTPRRSWRKDLETQAKKTDLITMEELLVARPRLETLLDIISGTKRVIR